MIIILVLIDMFKYLYLNDLNCVKWLLAQQVVPATLIANKGDNSLTLCDY